MAEKQNLTAAQRAQNFAQSTRQNLQMMATQTVSSGGSSISFTLPKARLFSGCILDFEFKLKIKHGSKTTLPDGLDVFTPYNLVRRIAMNFNLGFQPYVLAGRELAMLNMVSHYHGKYYLGGLDNTDGFCYWLDKGASPEGKEQTVRFTLDMSTAINERDPISLIMLQNDQTVVDVVVDIANGTDIFGSKGDGYEVEIVTGRVTPVIETFSIPAKQEAFPDISVLKLVDSRNENFVGSGQHVLKLLTGTIYRRLIIRFTDKNGGPVEDEVISSPLELVFNQADTNYSILPRMLKVRNAMEYGFMLPRGMYVFDFAYQGTVNLGGTRDYIDTEALTEFWLRFNSTDDVCVTVVKECITRLR